MDCSIPGFPVLNHLTLTSIELRVPSNHPILCRPLLLSSSFGAQENKVSHCFHFVPIYLPWSDGTRAMILAFFFFLGCAGSWCCSRADSCYGKWGPLCSYSAQAAHCHGFSCFGAWSLGNTGFSSCSSWAPECRLISCGTWTQVPSSMWDLPRLGTELVSLAWQGGFLTTGPPRKPWS